MLNRVNLEWLPFFQSHQNTIDYILNEIQKQKNNGIIIYPHNKNIFRSLFYFPPQFTKLVIIGQDPYINSEIINNKNIPQANGLSFSVPKKHKKIPPSLQNIFKEIKNSYPDYIIPTHGFLKNWVVQGVLLLNSSLTVIEGKSNSHAKLWNNLTDKLIKFICDNNENTVFLLMGNFAAKKAKLITNNKTFITIHPSPLSAFNGFFGCNVFLDINNYLISKNINPINW
jgi:uracil-DNA glycosylase